VVTRQLQVERWTWKVRRSKTNVLTTVPRNQPCADFSDDVYCQKKSVHRLTVTVTVDDDVTSSQASSISLCLFETLRLHVYHGLPNSLPSTFIDTVKACTVQMRE